MMMLSWAIECKRTSTDWSDQYRFSDQKPTKKSLVLGKTDTIKVSLTTTEAGEPKRPHQAFLILTESTGLEAPFPLKMKASGKGEAEIVRNQSDSNPFHD